MLILFLKGLAIGFAIAAPVGPIGILCIQRSLHSGFKIGLMTGLGAALADGTYGLIAGLGLTTVSSLMTKYQVWIQLFGGVFLIYLGFKLFFKPYHNQTISSSNDKSSWHAFGTTYFLTLTNPATLLSFIAIFAGLGLGTTNPGFVHAVLLVTGITLGSATWWLLLSSSAVFILHKRISKSFLHIINWVSGLIIFIFGVCIIAYALEMY